jgi:hypothetical protein
MRASSKADDEAHENTFINDEKWDWDADMAAAEEQQDPLVVNVPYEPINYRPKFSKERAPKVKKIKKRRILDRSDPVMDTVELPPGMTPTARGPRLMSPDNYQR